MKKADIIADIAARSEVSAVLGDPQLISKTLVINGEEQKVTVETVGGHDFREYQQPVLLLVGKVGQKGTIRFNTVDEGTDDEIAFYPDREPENRLPNDEFRDWLKLQLFALVQSGDLKSFKLLDVSEEAGIAMVKTTIADPDNAGQVLPVAYQCTRVNGALVREKVSLAPETVAQISSI